ncbi:MAG: methylated-DNA--[protein]-cysteine S-methyltransferase [Candidatus Brocadia sp.]|nr:MAG: methylated-DNA--[protein]-cysteine S-methyltransferase [Candidatus Brocadia sp.]
MLVNNQKIIYFSYFSSPIGDVCVAKNAKGICRISFPHKGEEDFLRSFLKDISSPAKNADVSIKIQRNDSFLKAETDVLNEYFHGRQVSFDFPIDLDQGTPFQKKVWKKLMTIPYGECRYYKWVAKEIGQPLASRAVGMANNKNPVPPIVPCHRVIGSNGSLTGYASGISVKKQLLEMEYHAVHGRSILDSISENRRSNFHCS